MTDPTDLAGRLARRHRGEAMVDARTGRRHSYHELAQRAAQTAAWLASEGVAKGDRVALLSENRLEAVDLMLACNRLGAVLAPLNVRLSRHEVAALVADCDPALIITSRRHADLAVGRCIDEGIRSDGPARPAALAPDDPAFILYTGGTTGLPKGAVLPWRAVLANAANTIAGWGLDESDTAPLLFPFFHTGGWNVLTLPLLVRGGRTILMGDFDAELTLDMVARERCTRLIGVPTMFHAIAASPAFAEADLSSLKECVSGGAPCPAPIIAAFQERGLVFRLGYGLTEAGPNNFRTDAATARAKPQSVGRAMPGVRLRIAGGAAEGELQILGDHVFDGYWRRPDATAASFTDDGWLRTGDVARVDADGDHFIVDRLKDMFISGGENVYPVEVEKVLEGHPAVDLVAVIAVPDERWGEVGKAVIQVRPGASLDTDELLAFARQRLGRYKVPRYVETIEAMPLSGAGKVLKTELRRSHGDA